MSGPLKVLLIEDNPVDARLIYAYLQGKPGDDQTTPFLMERAERLSAGIAYLAQNKVDVVLLDLFLPDSRGLETFMRLQTAVPNVPVVVLSGMEDEMQAVQAVQQGAQDYLMKKAVNEGLLTRSIRYAVERYRVQQDLRGSESRYRFLAENVVDVIWTMDMSFNFTDVSPSVCQLLGYSPEEFLKLGWERILSLPSYKRLSEEFKKNLRPGNLEKRRKNPFLTFSLELEYVRKNRFIVWADVKIKLLLNDQENPVGFLGVTRDITSHKEAERVRQRRTDELAALYDTGLEVNALIELETLLQSIVDRAARLAGAQMGRLYLWDNQDNLLRMKGGYKLPVEPHGETLQLKEGLAGKAAELGEVLCVNDRQPLQENGTGKKAVIPRCELAVPMKVHSHVLGVIHLVDKQENSEFSSEEIRLVSMFANQAAIAVDRAHLYEMERKRSKDLERSNAMIAILNRFALTLETTYELEELLQSAGEGLKQFGLNVLIALSESEEPGSRMVIRHVSTLEVEIQARMENLLGGPLIGFKLPEFAAITNLVKNHSPSFKVPVAFLQDIFPGKPDSVYHQALDVLGVDEKIRVVSLPMASKGIPVGVILVWGHNLTYTEMSPFFIFANQVAAAIENANLYNRIKRLSVIDELTGLFNRRGFFEFAERQRLLVLRNPTPLLLLFLDMDHLKRINDQFGHNEGDHALVNFARILTQTFRSSDIVARMGGDEFAVLTIETPDSSVEHILQRLRHNLDVYNRESTVAYPLSASCGSAAWNVQQGELSIDRLLAEADNKMYVEKRNKKLSRANELENQPVKG